MTDSMKPPVRAAQVDGDLDCGIDGFYGLHRDTLLLIQRFAYALACKLAAAEKKYGYSNNWMRPDWMDECRNHLMQHIAKGDPRDVAAYCAFLWHHGESTAPTAKPLPAQVDAGRIAEETMQAWGDRVPRYSFDFRGLIADGIRRASIAVEPIAQGDGVGTILSIVSDVMTDHGGYDLSNDEDALGSFHACLRERLEEHCAQPRESLNGRLDRQRVVHAWCVAAFGDDHAASIEQRGIRLVEEAIEAGQACGCQPDMVHRLVDHIYGKPTGDLSQELGGVGVTMLALAQAAGLDADASETKEIERILSKPLAHFAARNAAKNAAGFNVFAATSAPGAPQP
ncbi:hypothetical protein [Rhodanobacter glycinis]|uniref:hypothetical protein n=1 Tax=Rhodanobacter glycinis TaxID=582702 RepID=UPI0019D57F69|nr:hypothetical protein [Rhodanobacter glycinis]